MKKGGIGGGKTITGLEFEDRVDLLKRLSSLPGYSVINDNVLYEGRTVAVSLKKYKLYKFLLEKGVDYTAYLSKKLLPDDAIYVDSKKTLYVVEMKFQKVSGSVDEKLQTCDFKKKQYEKLMSPLGINVEYIYILSDWFEHHTYQDVKAYILSVGCKYYIELLPLEEIGIPMPVVEADSDVPQDVVVSA